MKTCSNSFTEEDQAIVRQAAVDAGAEGVSVARAGITGGDTSAVDAVSALGVNVIRLTDDERQAFVDATRDVYAKWKGEIGDELVDMAEKSISERTPD